MLGRFNADSQRPGKKESVPWLVVARSRKKTLLNRLYGQANPGTLTAFMGPSGAGKTTLLNILSGHYDKGYKGEVLVNGYVREAKLFNLQSSYVMQDDCLLGYLTVRETLTMSVELRTPTCGRRKISELVEDALDLWGLQGCANTLARSLSGGERKRLMIAQELMSDVPVVFLDEPTSGLDSCSALRCVRVLRTLADNGRTVLCSLHNPSASVFSQFDRLYMLSDGMCIYSGLTERLVPFLNSMNLHCLTFSSPSDFLTEVASGGHGELTVKLSSLFIPEGCPVSSEKERDDQGMVTIYGGRLMTHKERNKERRRHEVHANGTKALQLFMTLMKRFLYCRMRDKITSIARVGASLYFALLVSVACYCSGNRTERVRDTVAMYFAILFMLLFQSVTPILLTFPLEIKVLLKEQRNCCYSTSLYFTARIIAELPFHDGVKE
ncbi:ATP-binding cassette sub-family G member 1-like [Rhipicephalus sanguineus]|uniref:ATP-binding cassette sub-family G member 1-like n=1 Tax=Rhipicephalus sanguineus TaxID=34632 RepID=UPI0020C29ECD|nr:ATP-binding cassette sub-family G member 1-like [Rhipicephalus sanguineus]